MEIRRANREDVKHLAMIQTSSWKAAFKDIMSSECLNQYTDVLKCQEMLESVYDAKQGFFYIGFWKEKPCAELFWCEDREHEKSAEIVALHSVRESWGSGLGKAIMERAIEDIAKCKKEHIYLWVFEENHRARRFYEKCGFVPDGMEQISRFDDAKEVRYVLNIG